MSGKRARFNRQAYREELEQSTLQDTEQYESMRSLAGMVDEALNSPDGPDGPRRVGFILLTFNAGDYGRCNYASNGADRANMIEVMEELISRLKGSQDTNVPDRTVGTKPSDGWTSLQWKR